MSVKAPVETRHRILEAAFEEFHKHGFQGGSLNRIIEAAGTTKGALFHHFNGKHELGYAVVEELIRSHIQEEWFNPVAQSDDPVAALKGILRNSVKDEFADVNHLCNGCPLNNLAQEMSPLDEGFRTRIEAVYDAWRKVIEDGLRRGMQAGTIRKGVKPKQVATLLVAIFAGVIGTAKNAQSMEIVMDAGEALIDYLDTLKA